MSQFCNTVQELGCILVNLMNNSTVYFKYCFKLPNIKCVFYISQWSEFMELEAIWIKKSLSPRIQPYKLIYRTVILFHVERKQVCLDIFTNRHGI